MSKLKALRERTGRGTRHSRLALFINRPCARVTGTGAKSETGRINKRERERERERERGTKMTQERKTARKKRETEGVREREGEKTEKPKNIFNSVPSHG